MIKITAEMLRDRNCHVDSIKRFNNLFPDGLTLKSEQEAVDAALKVFDKFNFHCVAGILVRGIKYRPFEKQGFVVFHALRPCREFHRCRQKAICDWEKSKKRVFVETQESESDPWAGYMKYKKMRRDIYFKGEAEGFARAFWKQEVGE